MVIAEDEIVDRFQMKSVIAPVKIRTLCACAGMMLMFTARQAAQHGLLPTRTRCII